MRLLMGLVLAGALLAGTASTSEAQVSIGIGNGFGYPAYGVGGYSGFGYTPYGGYGVGPVVGYNNYYGPGYVGRPGGFAYSSAYQGFGPGYGAYGYGGRPYARGYGYGGFRPFGGFRRGFR